MELPGWQKPYTYLHGSSGLPVTENSIQAEAHRDSGLLTEKWVRSPVPLLPYLPMLTVAFTSMNHPSNYW